MIDEAEQKKSELNEQKTRFKIKSENCLTQALDSIGQYERNMDMLRLIVSHRFICSRFCSCLLFVVVFNFVRSFNQNIYRNKARRCSWTASSKRVSPSSTRSRPVSRECSTLFLMIRKKNLFFSYCTKLYFLEKAFFKNSNNNNNIITTKNCKQSIIHVMYIFLILNFTLNRIMYIKKALFFLQINSVCSFLVFLLFHHFAVRANLV